ncbi:MAG: 50S ribosomal protein L4 [Buchnera aphidicola (Periphyllus lyropictus)]|uniref:50S ribosomal protein L4 n=1 Tax=Buchnera aphidicola TaxID=9 RepID=UPI001EBA0185|nr:50S ribosomal protein L4 [Buchnera aphidicola]NIH16474.1 50S ribosomal protein L4 [Buchnera aphidicola (Periphyllus lyropictus)]USS94759.1 50S ribosomal protein L4 [Buchnera aphidicola (Periphyllus lyropictus)]
MELKLKDTREIVKISELVFNRNFNKSLVNQVLKSLCSSKRQGTKSQKSRAEVSGSGKKPWRQKGTGRARVGSIRSPIWRSGGVTFASKNRDYNKKINKKMYRGALKCIFSELVRKNRLIIFKNFKISNIKTKILINKLKKLDLFDVMIVKKELDKKLLLSSRNIYKVKFICLSSLNPLNLLTHKNVLMTLSAFKKVEEKLL